MIAKVAHARRFAPLARYLVRDPFTSGERVAWTATRNLGTDDPELAAALMQATAAQNSRVRLPVYHVVLSFDAADSAPRHRMEAITDYVLRELRLADRQALLVAHGDRRHPHLHAMMNRVHVDTSRAWARWQDWPRIHRVIREAERAWGLRQVHGVLYDLDEPQFSGRASLTTRELHEEERTGERALSARIRARVPALRLARSWEELAEVLGADGLRLERRRTGLVVTDGRRWLKASRVGRVLSLSDLELRLGQRFPGGGVECRSHFGRAVADGDGPAMDTPAPRHAAGKPAYAAMLDWETAQAERRHLQHATECLRSATGRFERALMLAFRDPEAVSIVVRRLTRQYGAARAAHLVVAEPGRFGAVRVTPRRLAFSLRKSATASDARRAVEAVAARWAELHACERVVVSMVGASPYVADRGTALAAAERAQTRMDATLERLAQRHQEPLGESRWVREAGVSARPSAVAGAPADHRRGVDLPTGGEPRCAALLEAATADEVLRGD